MTNPISDFMSNWLNTTYKYLRESGGGPTYPAPTTGPNVLPSGPYNLIEDYPLTVIPPTQYVDTTQYKDTAPISFNPYNIGLPALKPNQDQSIDEEIKQNPITNVISGAFAKLYGNNMKACMDNQNWGMNNPNAQQACTDCAATGDLSLMILNPAQKNALGIIPEAQNVKPDDVQLAENEASLTSQIRTGIGESVQTWRAFAAGLGAPIRSNPSGNKTVTEDPAGVNFQTIGKTVLGLIPKVPGAGNTDTIVMIGGGVLLLVLVIAIIK